jgi:hypothetical protein
MDTDKNKEKWMPASTMLDDMDIRYDRRGKRRIFSIKFVTLSGKLHYFPQCYAQGAGKMNNKEYRMRGLQPCDCKGYPEAHAFAVKITNILEYNGFKIDWNNGHTIQ